MSKRFRLTLALAAAAWLAACVSQPATVNDSMANTGSGGANTIDSVSSHDSPSDSDSDYSPPSPPS